jgi:hypothetical protein
MQSGFGKRRTDVGGGLPPNLHPEVQNIMETMRPGLPNTRIEPGNASLQNAHEFTMSAHIFLGSITFSVH